MGPHDHPQITRKAHLGKDLHKIGVFTIQEILSRLETHDQTVICQHSKQVGL